MNIRVKRLFLATAFLLCAMLGAQAQVSAFPATADVVAGDTFTFVLDGLPTDTNFPLCTVTLASYDPERVRVIASTVEQRSHEVTIPDPSDTNVPPATITYTEYESTLPVAVAAHHRMEGLFDPVPVAVFVRRPDEDGWISFSDTTTFSVHVLDPVLCFFPFDDLYIQQSSVEPIVLTRTADAFATLEVNLHTDIGNILGLGASPDASTHSEQLTVFFQPFETIQVLYASGRALAEEQTDLSGHVYAQVGSYEHGREITVTRHPELILQPSGGSSGIIHAGDSFMLEITRDCTSDQWMTPYPVSLQSQNPDIAGVPASATIPAGAGSTWVMVNGRTPGATVIHATGPNALVTDSSSCPVTVLEPVLFFTPGSAQITAGETGTLLVNRDNRLDSAELSLEVESLSPELFQPLQSTLSLAPGEVSAAMGIAGLVHGEGLLQIRNGTFSTNVPVRVVDNVTGIRVTITPPEAVAAGAQWRVDGGAWQDSGSTLTGTPGLKTVEFKDLPDWVTPAARQVELAADMLMNLSAEYIPATGLVVFLSPPEAISDGAQWRVAGGDWHSSGAMETNVSANPDPLEFKELDGWFAPTSTVATVTPEDITYVERNYYAGEALAGAGTELGQVRSPSGLAFDSQGRLYVAEADFPYGHHRVQRRNTDGTWELIGGAGTGSGEFSGPFSLACDGDALYVGDIGDNRVQRRNPDGTWEAWGGTSQSTNPEIGKFRGPFDLAVDDAGGLIVADLYNNRVQRRAPDGVWSLYLPSGTGPSAVWMPSGATWWSARLVVADFVSTENFTRLRTFTAANSAGTSIGSSNPGDGSFGRAYGLNAAGTTLLAADSAKDRILAYEETDAAWRLVFSGYLKEPRSAVLGPDGKLYIADTGHHRILRIDPPALASMEPLSFSESVEDHTLMLDIRSSSRTSTADPLQSPTLMTTLDESSDPVFLLRWQAHPQARYSLQFKTNLSDTAEGWKNVPGASAIPGVSGWMEVPILPDESSKSKVFRVRQTALQ